MKRSEKIEYVQKFLKESVEKGFPYPFQVLTEDGFFLFRLKNGKHECCARLRQTEELLNILCEGTKAEKEAATERIFDILRAAIRAQTAYPPAHASSRAEAVCSLCSPNSRANRRMGHPLKEREDSNSQTTK